jgi:hypothetical protein
MRVVYAQNLCGNEWQFETSDGGIVELRLLDRKVDQFDQIFLGHKFQEELVVLAKLGDKVIVIHHLVERGHPLAIDNLRLRHDVISIRVHFDIVLLKK